MKAVIFDFDYTLGDSSMGIAESINYALNRLGFPSCSQTQVNKTIGLSLRDTFAYLTNNTDAANAKAFSEYFKDKADRVMVENTTLYPFSTDLLDAIKRNGWKIAIVTSKFHYRIEQILNKFDITSKIDIIIGCEDVNNEKPAPDGLLLSIEKLGVTREDAVYVGDSRVDAEAAERAGIGFIAVLTGTTSNEAFGEFDNLYVARDLSDVYGFLFKGDCYAEN